MKKLVSTLAVALLWTIPASADETVRHLSKQIPTADVERVSLDFPVGQLLVDGWDSQQVDLDVRLECERDTRSCREAAQKVRLVYSTDDGQLHVEMKDWPKMGGKGLEAHIQIKVPRRLALNADLGVGEMRIAGIEGHLNADLGVGELSVTMPESAVASVNADTGVGEANLTVNGKHYESSGFIAKEIRWKDGNGNARVQVDCGVGEIDVRLQ
ncbi:MAG TPA: hypothetical protein VF756_23890 [Thermoanaerobaculia bacterium]